MLVIFDCDGVLVDTETIANGRLAEMMTAAGLPITMAECRRRFMGRPMTSIRDLVLTEDGIDLGADFAERWYAILPELFSGGVDAIPHVETAIGAIDAAGVPLCVASSGRVEKMHITLGAAGLLPRLEPVLFSASMVPRGKPFPDLFLHAAATMGHAPQDCVVVEDSLAGVQAAIAAGMRALAYGADHLSDHDALATAGGEVFDDMRRLPHLLGIG